MHSIKTTCPYCGVGCGVSATVIDADMRQVDIQGDASHPANKGRLCVKGSALGETVSLEGRLLYPEIGGLRAGWDQALTAVAKGFQDTIAQHGPDSVAFYISGQLLTEDYYVANKLMKGFIGSANIDTNSRLCMSSAVAAYKRAFGEDVVPTCYEDLELADLIVLVGSNTAWCHPILFQRIKAAKAARPELKVVVVDPRRTATCEIADLHLSLAPGADVALFNAMFAALYKAKAVDEAFIAAHTQGFDEALKSAGIDDTLEIQAARCGLSPEALQQFMTWFIETERVLTLFSQGVNQSLQGVDKGNAIINCHLATGRIGRPGMGPFSLTGQPNAMGGREVGGLANQLAAHLDIDNAAHRHLVQTFWESPVMAENAGLKAVDMFDAIYDGKIKAVWIMATNPVVSLPDADRVREALAACPLVVVSDCIADTDTMRLAHIKLPALAWAEKDGTVTNSERRISRQRAFFSAPGEAKPDWWIIAQVAARMGAGKGFSYASAADVFTEHAALSGFQNEGATRRVFNIAALSQLTAQEYEALTPCQWPLSAQAEDTARPFAEHRYTTTDGHARFVAVALKSPGNARDDEYPLCLNTGRIRDQWHTMTRTALTPRLLQHISESYAELSPQDAETRGIKEGDLVTVSSRWGQALVRAQVTEAQQPGSVFVPMHWTDVLSRTGRIGAVVNPVVDPLSGQPESKHTPVQVAKADIAWQAVLLTRQAVALPETTYAVSVRADKGFRYLLASDASAPHWSSLLPEWLGHNEDCIEFRDDALGVARFASLEGDTLQAVVVIFPAGQMADVAWVQQLLGTELDTLTRRAVLSLKPADPSLDVGRTICACFSVGEKTIRQAVREKGLDSVASVGKCLRAGTNCGSCQSEIAVIVKEECAGREHAA